MGGARRERNRCVVTVCRLNTERHLEDAHVCRVEVKDKERCVGVQCRRRLREREREGDGVILS